MSSIMIEDSIERYKNVQKNDSKRELEKFYIGYLRNRRVKGYK
jgi:hypothetical protein